MSDNKDLKNGKIEIEDLEKYLEENRDEIDYVVLNWVCTDVVIHCETSYEVDDDSVNYPKAAWLYAEFSADWPDDEYSYAGDVDGAIEFAKSYGCWDGHEFTREGPVLYGEEFRYDPDDHHFPRDDDALTDPSLCNLRFEGLGYYGGRNGNFYRYEGPIRKKGWIREFEELPPTDYRCPKCDRVLKWYDGEIYCIHCDRGWEINTKVGE